MKKKLFFRIIICLHFTSLFAVSYNSEPKIFIQELVDDAVKTLSDKSISVEEKNETIEKIAKENVDINLEFERGYNNVSGILTKNVYEDTFKSHTPSLLKVKLTLLKQ